MIDKFLRFLKRKEKKEYYTSVRPQDYERLVKKGVQLELSDLRRENLALRKELEEKEKLIEKLMEELEKKKKEEIEQAKALMIEVERANRYDLFFQNLIRVVSGGPSNFPFTFNGKVYEFWVGIRFENTENGLIIKPILMTRDGKKAVLSPEPPISLYEFFDLIYDKERLIYYLRNGLVKFNILPDGTRIIPEVEMPVIRIEEKEVEKHGEKQK